MDERAPITVEADGGRWVGLTGEEILACPGLSAGARGVALLGAVLDRNPNVAEITALTGDDPILAARWIAELTGTGYLDWEG